MKIGMLGGSLMEYVSQSMIARRLGVAQRTVSKALRGEKDISEKVRERILAAAKELGYRQNLLVEGVLRGKSMIVGLLFPILETPYFSKMLRGVADELARHHYRLLIGHRDNRRAVDDDDLEMLLKYRVSGLIVIPRAEIPIEDSVYARLAASDSQIVFIDQKSPFPQIASVRSNDIEGAMQATRHLLDLGHRRIAYCGPDYPYSTSSVERRRGYREAMREAGCPTQELPVCGEATEELGTQLARLMRSRRRSTAFFCFNDDNALQIIAMLRLLGLETPRDVSVVGYGDDVPHVEHMRTPLTTVSQNPELLGKLAAEIVVDKIAGKVARAETVVDTSLIVRDSTRQIDVEETP